MKPALFCSRKSTLTIRANLVIETNIGARSIKPPYFSQVGLKPSRPDWPGVTGEACRYPNESKIAAVLCQVGDRWRPIRDVEKKCQ